MGKMYTDLCHPRDVALGGIMKRKSNPPLYGERMQPKNILLPPAMSQWLEIQAEIHKTSMGQIIRDMIQEAMNNKKI